MDKKLRKEYIRHLKNTTSRRNLRKYAIEFYDDLSKKYEGKVFTRDDFETLNVDGKEIEQDVVKHVFKDKNTATAEEIFTFLFKQNVKSIYLGKKGAGFAGNVSGYLDASTQILGLKKKDLMIAVMFNQNRPGREFKKFQKQNYEYAVEKREKAYREVLYHELSHVFEVKTFGKRKYYKNANGVFFKAGIFKYIRSGESCIKQENIAKDIEKDALLIKNKYRDTPSDVLNIYKNIGKTSLFEIFNEISAQKVAKDALDLSKASTGFGVMAEKARCKISLNGYCGYNKNYPMLELLKLALPEDMKETDFKFNTKRLEENINKLNISKKTLDNARIAITDDICAGYAETFRRMNINSSEEKVKKVIEQEYEFIKQIVDGLKDADAVDVVYTLMGVSENFEDIGLNSNCKKELQAIFVESIKNDIISQLKDEKIEKNQDFFEKIDKTLQKIDENLYYPDRDIQFLKHNPSNPPNPIKNITEMISISTVERFAEEKDCPKNIKVFAELTSEVKKALKEHNLKGFESEFFKEQDKIEQKYQDILKEEQVAKLEQEVAKKQREEKMREQLKRPVKVGDEVYKEFGEEWA